MTSSINRNDGGVLAGLRVLELGGIGPVPFCAMMLADHGAVVTRVCRPGPDEEFDAASHNVLHRNKRSVTLDLSGREGLLAAQALCSDADVIIEGFRPGVLERLGLGPDVVMAMNPGVVFARMSGWGQSGPLASTAGHDINYIALTGALHSCGLAGAPPVPPLNLVGDFGGGGMMLAFGIVAACLSVQRGGRGQVIDCAMTDGSALTMSMIYSLFGHGLWTDSREANVLDGGCPFYATYEAADAKHIAVGALEDRFFALLVETLGLGSEPVLADRWSKRNWPRIKEIFARKFREKARDDWAAIFGSLDACVTPVLSLSEAALHPHNAARQTFQSWNGIVQPAAAPRFTVLAG